MSDKLFKTLAYLGGAAAIYSGFRKKKKAERNRIIAQQATLRAQAAAFSATQNNEQIGPSQVSNADPSQGSGSQTGATVNSTITGTGSYQMTADTNASLPILYGQCQVRGSVVDSVLEGVYPNNELRTVFVVAERTGDGAYGDADYTLNRLYWNDVELLLHANGTVSNAILSDGTVTQKYNNKMRAFFFQGDIDTPFANVLGSVPSYNQMYNITSYGFYPWNTQNHIGRGALWAYVVQDYDAEAGIQGLGTWTFDITNQDYSNPANVIHDYLSSGRYGHGYSNSVIDSGSLFSGADSLRNISDELRFFTSLDSADDANANIVNADSATQFVTNGNVFSNTYTTLHMANSDTIGIIYANCAGVGQTSFYGNINQDYTKVNRLKILWANSDAQGNVINVSMTSNNVFTAFLDIGRAVPDGAPNPLAGAEADVVAGNIYPGDTYDYGTPGNITPIIAPATPIENFLVEGDRIRPEGSPYVYTVASNVDVISPGYRTFEIPVKERIIQFDYANVTWNQDDANANIYTVLNTPGGNSGVYTTQTLGDVRGIYQVGGWPFTGAVANGAVTHPDEYDVFANVLFSNCLVGNATFSTEFYVDLPQEDTVYLGQEKQASINGLLSTEGDVQSNLRTLLQHSGATVTWDLGDGKWKTIPNSVSDTANAFVFNDDNIIGEIKVTTSDLSNFYNSARASYVEKTHNSVKEESIIYTPDSERATNETPHKLEMNYPLCSSGPEATRKIEQELIQNRLDLTINFTADYSAITVEPGDIVKVTNADYGFNEKLFRVLKTVQDMDGDILVINLVCLEWDLAIFRERIPHKKPVLDDIEFDPEDFDDNIDGDGLRPRANVTPGLYGDGTGSFDATGVIEVPVIDVIGGGLIDYVDDANSTINFSLNGMGTVLFAKNLGQDLIGNSNVLTSLGGGTHVFDFTDGPSGHQRYIAGDYVYSGHCMPTGEFTETGGVADDVFTNQHQTTIYVTTATSNTAYTSNLDVSSAYFEEGGYGNSVDFTVPANCTSVKVKWQASTQSNAFTGVGGPGYDNIRFWALRKGSSTVE